jgi:DNA-directed RNA polymerase subunit RPC12/RpoP
MKYYHKCQECGAEHQINTDRKIKQKEMFKCFRCGKLFQFKETEDVKKDNDEN